MSGASLDTEDRPKVPARQLRKPYSRQGALLIVYVRIQIDKGTSLGRSAQARAKRYRKYTAAVPRPGLPCNAIVGIVR